MKYLGATSTTKTSPFLQESASQRLLASVARFATATHIFLKKIGVYSLSQLTNR